MHFENAIVIEVNGNQMVSMNVDGALVRQCGWGIHLYTFVSGRTDEAEG